MISFPKYKNNIYKIKLYILVVCLLACRSVDKGVLISGTTMGTTYSILINSKTDINQEDIKASIDSLLFKINNKFSTYIDTSEISIFNNPIDSMMVSDDFINLFNISSNINKLSNGSFDFTILNIVELWGFGKKNRSTDIPNDLEIKHQLKFTGIDKLELDKRTLKKSNKNVKIDFSAIAKGWAVDQVALLIEDRSINNYMVEIGGEISTSGTNYLGELWTIGIASPYKEGRELIASIKISNRSIATSGTYNNSFLYKGNRYSHLIDPISGYPIRHDIISATILAHDCADADAIATAVMVKGYDAGLSWIDSMPDVECLLIKKDGNGEYVQGRSAGFNY